jgi:hypothetical protein
MFIALPAWHARGFCGKNREDLAFRIIAHMDSFERLTVCVNLPVAR